MALDTRSAHISSRVALIIAIVIPFAVLMIFAASFCIWYRYHERKMKQQLRKNHPHNSDSERGVPLRRLLTPQPIVTPTMYGIPAANFPITPPRAVIRDSMGQTTGPRNSMDF